MKASFIFDIYFNNSNSQAQPKTYLFIHIKISTIYKIEINHYSQFIFEMNKFLFTFLRENILRFRKSIQMIMRLS